MTWSKLFEIHRKIWKGGKRKKRGEKWGAANDWTGREWVEEWWSFPVENQQCSWEERPPLHCRWESAVGQRVGRGGWIHQSVESALLALNRNIWVDQRETEGNREGGWVHVYVKQKKRAFQLGLGHTVSLSSAPMFNLFDANRDFTPWAQGLGLPTHRDLNMIWAAHAHACLKVHGWFLHAKQAAYHASNPAVLCCLTPSMCLSLMWWGTEEKCTKNRYMGVITPKKTQ